ncbi:class I SAM-dependent rRNA methyltransferase [Owenweeksia hongkongensis]|uniref:class I SAM-dependent rRNA methyltransferase n=1 Tax=Owenweeksia hongkongensis TaxID=253245 RepID=UPI003A8CAABC
MNYNTISLKKGKEKFLHRKHPWIFSGAFKELPQDFEEGSIIEVLDFKGNFQALGFFHRKSIAVNILSFEPVENVEDLIIQKIKRALDYRNQTEVLKDNYTDCCRLVFGEGDNLSGLIIDKYADTAVIQIHLEGWIPYLQLIADTLMKEDHINHVFSKPADKISVPHNMIGTLAGESSRTVALEHGLKFNIDWEGGQKTGFFIDQRENRKCLADFSKGKKVLNTFSYSGGFSIYALQAGAELAVSVDISEAAVQLANENAELNNVADRHKGIASDVFEHLKNDGDQYDVIILDPPAFAKNHRSVHNAVQGYKRLNLAAMKKIKEGGIIFTFSCSQHVGAQLFEDTLRAAAIESGRNIKIMDRLTQPIDHPINIYHPEGEYLKGFILHIS